MVTRRRAWASVVAAALALALASCSDDVADEPATAPTTPSNTAGYHAEVPLGDRTYDIYVPPTRVPGEPTAALVAFHGMPGSPDTVRRDSGLDALADEEGFLVVYPRGVDQRWEPASGSKDLGYVEALIEDLVSSWDADPARIYVAGFSNGADMAIVATLALPDVVAGAAPVAPSGTGSVAAVIDELASPVPVIAFIGESDPRAEVGSDLFDAWRTGAGCDDVAGDSTDGVSTSTWTCDGEPFQVNVVAGRGHEWFGSPDEREPVWASEAMWEFFSELN